MPLLYPAPQNPLTSVKPSVSALQLQEKLKTIPGFVIIDAKGAPLTATIEGKQVVGAFLRHSDAKVFLENLQKQRADLMGMKVIVAPLATIQELVRKSASPLELAYVGDAEELKEAEKVRKAQGNDKPFQAVPLFMGKAEGKGYLTLSQGTVEVVPAFFSRRELQTVMDRYNKSRPAGSPEAQVELTSLEAVLQTMRTTSNPLFPKLIFVPSQAALAEAKALEAQLSGK